MDSDDLLGYAGRRVGCGWQGLLDGQKLETRARRSVQRFIQLWMQAQPRVQATAQSYTFKNAYIYT